MGIIHYIFIAGQENKTAYLPLALQNVECPGGGGGGGGGGGLGLHSLCDGWYICAAVLTPFFHFGRIEHDLFGVLFLIHQQQSYLLGYKNYQFLQKSIFLAPNSIFSSIFLGPIFSGQGHTYPSVFRPLSQSYCYVYHDYDCNIYFKLLFY